MEHFQFFYLQKFCFDSNYFEKLFGKIIFLHPKRPNGQSRKPTTLFLGISRHFLHFFLEALHNIKIHSLISSADCCRGRLRWASSRSGGTSSSSPALCHSRPKSSPRVVKQLGVERPVPCCPVTRLGHRQTAREREAKFYLPSQSQGEQKGLFARLRARSHHGLASHLLHCDDDPKLAKSLN